MGQKKKLGKKLLQGRDFKGVVGKIYRIRTFGCFEYGSREGWTPHSEGFVWQGTQLITQWGGGGWDSQCVDRLLY